MKPSLGVRRHDLWWQRLQGNGKKWRCLCKLHQKAVWYHECNVQLQTGTLLTVFPDRHDWFCKRVTRLQVRLSVHDRYAVSGVTGNQEPSWSASISSGWSGKEILWSKGYFKIQYWRVCAKKRERERKKNSSEKIHATSFLERFRKEIRGGTFWTGSTSYSHPVADPVPSWVVYCCPLQKSLSLCHNHQSLTAGRRAGVVRRWSGCPSVHAVMWQPRFCPPFGRVSRIIYPTVPVWPLNFLVNPIIKSARPCFSTPPSAKTEESSLFLGTLSSGIGMQSPWAKLWKFMDFFFLLSSQKTTASVTVNWSPADIKCYWTCMLSTS